MVRSFYQVFAKITCPTNIHIHFEILKEQFFNKFTSHRRSTNSKNYYSFYLIMIQLLHYHYYKDVEQSDSISHFIWINQTYGSKVCYYPSSHIAYRYSLNPDGHIGSGSASPWVWMWIQSETSHFPFFFVHQTVRRAESRSFFLLLIAKSTDGRKRISVLTGYRVYSLHD